MIDHGRVNYQKANLNNVLYSLGALYILHRLMMSRIDEEMYFFIDKSELFSIPGKKDEIETKVVVDKEGDISFTYDDEENKAD